MPPKGSGHRGSKGTHYNTRGSARLNAGSNSFGPYEKLTGPAPEHPDRLDTKRQKSSETPAQTVVVEPSTSASAMDIDPHAAEYAANAKAYEQLEDSRTLLVESEKLTDIYNEDIPLPDSVKTGYNKDDFLTAAKDASLPAHKQTILQNASRGSGSGTNPSPSVTPVTQTDVTSNSADQQGTNQVIAPVVTPPPPPPKPRVTDTTTTRYRLYAPVSLFMNMTLDQIHVTLQKSFLKYNSLSEIRFVTHKQKQKQNPIPNNLDTSAKGKSPEVQEDP